MLPIGHLRACRLAFADNLTDFMAVVAGGQAHIFAVFLFLYVAVLQHFAVDKQLVAVLQTEALHRLHAHSHWPEIVFLRLRVERV